MEPSAVAQVYFDAWNRRDAQAIVSVFAEGGTYIDPALTQPLTGEAIGAYAQGLWAAFPDLSFELLSSAENGRGLVAAQWRMAGTNHGSFGGLPPTGRAVSLPGADFIQVEGDKIRSVTGYFDSRGVPDALGLDVVVQPREIGPFTLGTSARVHNGRGTKPGAFSITVLEARKEEQQQVGDLSRQIATEMLGMRGFVGWVGVTIGDRMMTVTAWETPEDAQQLVRQGTHREAMQKFFGAGIASGGFTSVWEPNRMNARLSWCASCSRMADHEAMHGVCACGSKLPEPLAYW